MITEIARVNWVKVEAGHYLETATGVEVVRVKENTYARAWQVRVPAQGGENHLKGAHHFDSLAEAQRWCAEPGGWLDVMRLRIARDHAEAIEEHRTRRREQAAEVKLLATHGQKMVRMAAERLGLGALSVALMLEVGGIRCADGRCWPCTLDRCGAVLPDKRDPRCPCCRAGHAGWA